MMRTQARILPLLLAIVLAALFASQRPAFAGVVHYSFQSVKPGDSGGHGGVAELTIDDVTGEVLSHRVLFTAAACGNPHKLAKSPSGRIVLVNASEAGPNIFIYDPAREHEPVAAITVRGEPDEVRIADERAYVGTSSGDLVLIDLDDRRVQTVWRGRKELDPPGRRPEDLRLMPEVGLLAVSFQKDNRAGSLHGNRIALLDLQTLETRADLRLPRSMPELHNPSNRMEQGPGPEVVLHSAAANTLVVSLDLYGAMAVMDLDEARRGRLTRLEYLPTSPSGAFGNSFPDRFCLVHVGDRELVLALNSGEEGGGVLIDLESRAVVGAFEGPHGLETPVHLPALGRVVAASGGKLKWRQPEKVQKSVTPQDELVCLTIIESDPDINSLAEHSPVAVRLERISMPGPAPRLARASNAANGSLLVVQIESRGASRLAIFDAASLTIVSELDAHGSIVRLLGEE